MLNELTHFSGAVDISSYMKKGGYAGAKKVVKLAPKEVIDEVKKSKLRGRGGAGFPTGNKWSFITNKYPRYLVANADEGEPATFKDRLLMGHSPHLLIEGMLIAAYAIQAEEGFIYVRGEYPNEAQILTRAAAEAKAKGYLGKDILGSGFSFEVEIKRGAGAYVVGEETALLSSLMGRRGNAWYKPPYPPEEGLWNQPTIINNVETLCCVPLIMNKGAEWFSSIGTPESPGPKLIGVSGHAVNKGIYEYPMGVTIGEVLIKAGMQGHLKAVQVGGISGPIFAPDCLDFKLDYFNMHKVGGSLGSGAVLAMNHSVSMTDTLEAIAYFFAKESCGKCFPCRLGTHEIYKLAKNIAIGHGKMEYLPLIKQTMQTMFAASFCPLGQSVKQPIGSILDHFGYEIEAFIRKSRYLSGGGAYE